MDERAHFPHADLPARTRTISLVKGPERWRFHWAPGQERALTDALADMARDPDHPLDWFDVVVVTHQISHFAGAGTGPTLKASSDAA